jgi:hypothetical protein
MHERFRLTIHVVFYQEGEEWIAHCLEFDLMGDGATQHEALVRLSDAIALQIDASLEHRNPANLFSPADGKYFRMFAAGNDCCKGEVDIRLKADGVVIESAEYREYSNPTMALA